MAQRELQVTALRPAASAMETYVRPEFERNQAAIDRLTKSIKATNDARSKQQAQIDAVQESLAGGVSDPNDRTGWSTEPVYVAARLEARGAQYGDQLLTNIQDAYNSDFKEGSRDDGADLDGWLNEQFAPASEALGDNPFLLVGANSVLQGVRTKIKDQHLAYLDERAKNESSFNIGFTVDRIIHGKVPLNNGDGTQSEMNFFQQVEALDNYAVQVATTTHHTKGSANEAIFTNVLMTAESMDDPEMGLNYLLFAEQLRFAKAGDGVNPKAAALIEAAETRLEARVAQDAKAQADADKVKVQNNKREMTDSLVSSLIEANEEGTVLKLSADDYTRFANEADMDATEVNKFVNSMQDSFKVNEKNNQRENWEQMSSYLNSLRGSPQGIKDAYLDVYGQISDGRLHHSRLKEAQSLIKELETAAPIIKHKILEDAKRVFIKSSVAREDEWDTDANALEKKYTDEWYSHLNKFINEYYYVDPKDKDAKPAGYPSSNQLMEWAQDVEAKMNNTYAEEQAVVKASDEELATFNSNVAAELSASANRDGDGKLNIAWINPVGTAAIRSVTGSLDVVDIEEHYKSRPFVEMLVNIFKVDPTYKFKWGNPEFGVETGTAAEHFDRLYGSGAAAMFWEGKYGPDQSMTKNDLVNRQRSIQAIQNEYLAKKQK